MAVVKHDEKVEKLTTLQKLLDQEEIWHSDPDKAKRLHRQQSLLERETGELTVLHSQLNNAKELLELALEEGDYDTELIGPVVTELREHEAELDEMQLLALFGDGDDRDCYLEIKSGMGGLDSMKFVDTLVGMYTGFAEENGWQVDVLELDDDGVTRQATLKFTGERAFGWLKTERGIHRFVHWNKKGGGGAARQTCFVGVHVIPEVGELGAKVELQTGDLKIETMRASGAGGQHVNKRATAVRITHKPTGVSVRCEQERELHINKGLALERLQAKLQAMNDEEVAQKKAALHETGTIINWGSEYIRSYILDTKLISDSRCGYKSTKVDQFLSGEELLGKCVTAHLLKQVEMQPD
eukprot:TRINITY_DN67708_c3_g1_i1.p1 TRINITY_DN67708_c3_g1~~TRINITY_DN67708_c3_g1_i1.p1  ORF type:complete len:395 (+),score=40.10 TRINITY_DN67708_c3_g1_i1:121-1185(+)